MLLSMGGWALGGLTYASYNIVGAVVILPVLRHLTSDRDAVIAGVIAVSSAMLPAVLFFCCMMAYYPGIATATLPSDFLLQRLGIPLFHLFFQVMIFTALLESGTASVHAINERISAARLVRGAPSLSRPARLAIAVGILAVCMLLADRFGLVAADRKGLPRTCRHFSRRICCAADDSGNRSSATRTPASAGCSMTSTTDTDTPITKPPMTITNNVNRRRFIADASAAALSARMFGGLSARAWRYGFRTGQSAPRRTY